MSPKTEILFERLHQAIRSAERILLISDSDPDGDSIGSTLALFHWIRREGRASVTVFSPSPLPRPLFFLDGAHDCTTDPHVLDARYDLVITCDMSDLKKNGFDRIFARVPAGYVLWNLDHHSTNTRFGDHQIILPYPETSATCELVHQFFLSERIPVDEKMATAIMAGLLYDTGFFQNSGTTSHSLQAGSDLLKAGARFPDAIVHALHDKSMDGMRVWGLALARLRHHKTLAIATTYIRQDDLRDMANADEVVSGLSNFLNRVCSGCDAVLVLREEKGGTIRGSMRSLSRDLTRLARALNGGGHAQAMGFRTQGRIEEREGRTRIISTPAI